MNTYHDYLIEQAYADITAQKHIVRLKQLKKWCKESHYNDQKLSYTKLLKYLKHLRTSQTPHSIDNHLQMIRTYYNYLIAKGSGVENPAQDLRVKLDKRRLPIGLLNSDELEDLYYSFETGKGQDYYIQATEIRNKVITGLLVYQGLTVASLAKLELEHLHLNKGKLYVPSTTRSNSRELDLKPFQIMELLHYREEQHPIIAKRIGVNYQKLFPLGGKSKFESITGIIVKKLRKYNQKVTTPQYIRASVITNWLQYNEIRKVQYLAGHKRILSTEFYQQDNLESLKKAINKFHPLS